MLGWNISVKRQLDGGAAPATPSTACGPALAVWQSDIHGLEWLDALVAEGSARRLEAGSMPTRYTARAADLLPRLQPQPPCAATARLFCTQRRRRLADDGRMKTRADIDALLARLAGRLQALLAELPREQVLAAFSAESRPLTEQVPPEHEAYVEEGVNRLLREAGLVADDAAGG